MTSNRSAAICSTLFCFLLYVAAAAGADPIRGIIAQEIRLDAGTELQVSAELRADEMAVLHLVGEIRFLEGIELELVLSEVLKRYSDGFAVSLYSDIKPAPVSGVGDYTGKEVFYSVLPHANRFHIGIRLPGVDPFGLPSQEGPTSADQTPSPSGETAEGMKELLGVTFPIPPDQFPLLLVIQSISKGLPSTALTRDFFLAFQPLIARRGLLKLSLEIPEGFEEEAVHLFLDDEPMVEIPEELELDSGIHTVRVVSEVFKPQSASFAMSPAQTVDLSVPLELAVSFITVESLEGAVIYLDGEKLDLAPGQRKQLTEGEHTIRFKLDRYSVTKKFSVEAGMNYTIALGLDVQVKQEL